MRWCFVTAATYVFTCRVMACKFCHPVNGYAWSVVSVSVSFFFRHYSAELALIMQTPRGHKLIGNLCFLFCYYRLLCNDSSMFPRMKLPQSVVSKCFLPHHGVKRSIGAGGSRCLDQQTKREFHVARNFFPRKPCIGAPIAARSRFWIEGCLEGGQANAVIYQSFRPKSSLYSVSNHRRCPQVYR